MTRSFRDFVLAQRGVDVKTYNKYGKFGENCLQDRYNSILSEGLIKSYPSDKVIAALRQEFKGILQRADVKLTNFNIIAGDGTPADMTHTITTNISDRNPSEAEVVKRELNKMLGVYGWYVGKMNVDWRDTYRYQIEPLHMDEDIRDSSSGKFYHVTDAISYKKIQKNGLNPRESSTSFSHTGNRIYILQTPTPEKYLPEVATMLHDNKRDTAKETGNVERADRWTPENQVYLELDLPENVKLFKDPMFPSTIEEDGMIAYYITVSIPPQNIKEIDFDDYGEVSEEISDEELAKIHAEFFE